MYSCLQVNLYRANFSLDAVSVLTKRNGDENMSKYSHNGYYIHQLIYQTNILPRKEW